MKKHLSHIRKGGFIKTRMGLLPMNNIRSRAMRIAHSITRRVGCGAQKKDDMDEVAGISGMHKRRVKPLKFIM
jgi:hypothetical protein